MGRGPFRTIRRGGGTGAMDAIGNPEMGIYIDSRKHIVRRKGNLDTVHAVVSNRFETQVLVEVDLATNTWFTLQSTINQLLT